MKERRCQCIKVATPVPCKEFRRGLQVCLSRRPRPAEWGACAGQGRPEARSHPSFATSSRAPSPPTRPSLLPASEGWAVETAEPHPGGTAEGHLSLNLHLGRGGREWSRGPTQRTRATRRDAGEAPVAKASALPTPGGTAPRYPTCQQGAPCPFAGPGPSAAWHGGGHSGPARQGRRPAPGPPTPPTALGSSCGGGSTHGVHSRQRGLPPVLYQSCQVSAVARPGRSLHRPKGLRATNGPDGEALAL